MLTTLRSETFADQPNREIIVFRGNKLSRIEAFRKIRGRRKNEGKIFFIIRIFSVNLYNSAFLIFIFVTIKMNWGEELKKIRKNEKFEKFEKSEKFRGNKLSRMKIFERFRGINFRGKGQKTRNRESF